MPVVIGKVAISTSVVHSGESRFGVSQRMTLKSAKFTYRVPVVITLYGGVTYANHVVDLGASEQELDQGLSYRLGQPLGTLEIVAFSEWRMQVASIAKGTEQRFESCFKLRL